MKTGKSRYRSLLKKDGNPENPENDRHVERERYFEYELTRLARMVSSQRQIYLSTKDNQYGSIPGELTGMEPFWTDPVDLENSYRADQRALLILYKQAQSEGIFIKDWLKQLVTKSLSDPPDRKETGEKLREIMSGFGKYKQKKSSHQTDSPSDVSGNEVIGDVNKVTLKKLAFAKKFETILESFIKS